MASPSNTTEATTAAVPLPIHPTRKELRECQFSNWYETFSNLPNSQRRNVTIKSVVIRHLPSDFIEYLQSDGIRLPVGATTVSSCAPNERTGQDAWSSDSDEEEDDNDDDNDEDDNTSTTPRQYSFPQLNTQIENAIQELGGSVIPKLNWSCPKDATWMNNGTLKCQTPGDVYLLLKSSDFCMHDLSVEEVNEYELVLRKWCNLHASMEFRCYVYNHELVAISQRQHTLHFSHLQRDRVVICSLIMEFFDSVIEERFPLPYYVFDVYIDKRERVWLLDFNVWATQTDSLLFTWHELVSMASEDGESSFPEMRVVETAREVHHDPLASYRAPIDTVQLAAVAGSDRSKFEEFMALCQRPSEFDNDEDNDDGDN